eukprot:gene30604-23622_t
MALASQSVLAAALWRALQWTTMAPREGTQLALSDANGWAQSTWAKWPDCPGAAGLAIHSALFTVSSHMPAVIRTNSNPPETPRHGDCAGVALRLHPYVAHEWAGDSVLGVGAVDGATAGAG